VNIRPSTGMFAGKSERAQAQTELITMPRSTVLALRELTIQSLQRASCDAALHLTDHPRIHGSVNIYGLQRIIMRTRNALSSADPVEARSIR
jgi:hypothetical protein